MSNRRAEFLSKIEDGTATVGVIGLSYVSLPLAVEIAKVGYKTIDFDVQEQKVEQVNRTHSYIGGVVDSALESVVKSGRLSTINDFSFISSVGCVAICMPTPLGKYQQPDISYVKGSTESVTGYLHAGMLVILESTTYPDTTEGLLKPILGESGLVCGEGFFPAFSPERVNPGNKQYKTKNAPRIVGGVGRGSTKVAVALYRSVPKGGIYEVASPAVTEVEKLLEDTYRNINIDLANEIAIICNRMDIDTWDVIDATETKPYGFQAFYPGPSLGGHCIPFDPFYLTWKTREYNYHARLVEISGEISTTAPGYAVDRAMKVLNRNKTTMSGARVLILGVAYRNDVDNYYEPPALNVIDHLLEQGTDAVFFGPYIPEYKHKGNVHKGPAALANDELKNVGIVIIYIAHECFDYSRVQSLSKTIFGTRNAMKDIADRSNIELLQCGLTRQVQERRPGQRSFLRKKPRR